MLPYTYFTVFDIDDGLVGFFCVGGSAQVQMMNTYNPDFIDKFGFKQEIEFTNGITDCFIFSRHLGYSACVLTLHLSSC